MIYKAFNLMLLSILSFFVFSCSNGDATSNKSSKNDVETTQKSESNISKNIETKIVSSPIRLQIVAMSITPKTAVIFKGETLKFNILVTLKDKTKKDLTADVKWSVDNPDLARVDKGGLVTGLSGGNAVVSAEYSNLKKDAKVSIIKCNNTISKTQVSISGENWPGNDVDPGGANYEDYNVVIKGDLIVDGYQIFSKKDQQIQVNYSLGSPYATTQIVNIKLMDYNGKNVDQKTVSSGSGTATLNASKGNYISIITKASTKGYKDRVYELIKDNEYAFRIQSK